MKKLTRRWRFARRRARNAERSYGWLFPVIAPFCAIAVVFITMAVPLVAHWQAVREVDAMGARVVYGSAAGTGWFGVPDAILTEVERIELTGTQADDSIVDRLEHIRGLDTVVLGDANISDQAIERLQRRRPQLVVTR